MVATVPLRWFPRPASGAPVKMKVGDPRLRLTDEQQMHRAVMADEGLASPTILGCKGISLVHLCLLYASYNDFYTVSVAHALLYGVGRGLVAHMFRPMKKPADGDYPPDIIPHAARNLIKERAKDIRLPTEYGRKYKCVEHYEASFRMEDWLHFTCDLSEYIFLPGTLPPLLQRLWNLFVTAVEHYCRAGFTDAASQKAADSLFELARLMQEYGFPSKMFTYNLHICVCRLRQQELARGAVSASMEFVVERVMQVFKTGMGRRVCQDPEKPFTNNFLLAQSLAR